MNKTELVDAVAERVKGSNITKKQVDAALTNALNVIVEAVANGDKVTLVGFGSFDLRDRKAREGRNPRTGEKINIPAKVVPVFSPGKPFKEKIASC